MFLNLYSAKPTKNNTNTFIIAHISYLYLSLSQGIINKYYTVERKEERAHDLANTAVTATSAPPTQQHSPAVNSTLGFLLLRGFDICKSLKSVVPRRIFTTVQNPSSPFKELSLDHRRVSLFCLIDNFRHYSFLIN